MFDFFKNNKGYISIFVLGVMLPVMIIEFVLIDYARLMAVRSQAAAVAETYGNSYLSVYDEMLSEVYGLFGISQNSKETLKDLNNYMNASYNPNSVSKTTVNGSADAAARIVNFIQGKTEYEKALQLTGGAIVNLNAETVPEKNLGDKNELMAQINEYIKLIGPTEIAITAISKIFTSSKSQKNAQTANDMATQIVNEQEIINEKNSIDAELQTLNDDVAVLYDAMKKYNTELNKLYDEMYSAASGSVKKYSKSIGDLIALAEKLDSAVDEAQIQESVKDQNGWEEKDVNDVTFSLCFEDDKYKKTWEDVRDFYSEGFTEKYYSYSTTELLNYDTYIKNWVKDLYIDGNTIPSGSKDRHTCGNEGEYCLEDIANLRNKVVEAADRLENDKNIIFNRIDDLIDNAREKGETEMADEMEKEYANVKSGDNENNGMYYVTNYNYGAFAIEFKNSAKGMEENLKTDFLNVYESEQSPFYGIKYYDSTIKALYEKIEEIYGYYTGDTSKNPKTLGDLCENKITETNEYKKLKNSNSIPNNMKNKEGYVTDFSTTEEYKYPSEAGKQIGIKKVYEILGKWNGVTDEQQKTEDSYTKLKNIITNMMNDLSFDDIAEPRCYREVSYNDEDVEGANGSFSFKSLFNSNTNNDSSTSFIPSMNDISQKLMLMMYDYGMFTCQTSDLEEKDDAVNRIQPVSYQQIKLANGGTEGPRTDDNGFNESETNYLLYGEMEYIFGGKNSSYENFCKVRNSLALVRFVLNYASTYKITEVNTMVGSIRNALTWCPLLAVVVAQVVRVGIAVLETASDLESLYEGKSVPLFKTKFGDLESIGRIKDAAAESGVDLEISDSNEKSNSIKVDYKTYLLLLQALFVDTDTMLKRTGNLIEINMNYLNGTEPKKEKKKVGWSTEEKEVEVLKLDDDSWRLDKCVTAVNVTCEVKNDFVILGSLNLSGTGYENASKIGSGNTYKVEVETCY